MKTTLFIVILFVSTFSLSAQAGTLPEDVLNQHPELKTTADSLKLAHDDWPESEPQVLIHCLQELKKWAKSKPNLSVDRKLQHFDNCSLRWTTVGSLKSEYTD